MRLFRGSVLRLGFRATLGVLLALAFPAARGVAQEPHGLEAGIEATSALADPAFAGGGVSVGIRPGGGTRVVLSVLSGVQRSQLAGRAELLGQLMLTPGQAHGVGFYGIAGVAGEVGRRDAGWLVLGLGIEGSPAARSGWHLEAGIGGGVRLSAGWRWRWLHTAVGTPP